MPTGYTAELIEKRMEFNDFVLTCARAFGACIELRDEKLAPAPRKIPSNGNYHEEQLEKAIKELEDIDKLHMNSKLDKAKAKQKTNIEYLKKALLEGMETNKRLKDMEDKVIAWIPPTNDHAELKEFMLDQIKISYANVEYYEKELKTENDLPLSKIVSAIRDSLKWSVDYHGEYADKDKNLNKDRSEWLDKLYVSLGL